ncbi:MAG: hypothetical protein HOV80_09110 [Polyangiaceae bacterium]|nr:hypothetical protein [Polyangiaceae bacterium]
MPRGTAGADTEGAAEADAARGSAEALASAVVELFTASTVGEVPEPMGSEETAMALVGAPLRSAADAIPRSFGSLRMENATTMPIPITSAPPTAKSPSLGRRSWRCI